MMAITQTNAPTITVTTWTHLQGTDEFCWLFGLTSSIHRTLLVKSGIWILIKEIKNYFLIIKN